MIFGKKMALVSEIEVADEQSLSAAGGEERCQLWPTLSVMTHCGGDGKGGYNCFSYTDYDDVYESCWV